MTFFGIQPLNFSTELLNNTAALNPTAYFQIALSQIFHDAMVSLVRRRTKAGGSELHLGSENF
jgi:hypothetical protein